MNLLTPCLQDEADCTSDDMKLERADVLSYHAWLTANAEAAPFTTLVILHNLVTDSIASNFARGGQHRFACARDVARALQGFLGFNFEPNVLAPPKGSLPGVGRHRLVDCS